MTDAPEEPTHLRVPTEIFNRYMPRGRPGRKYTAIEFLLDLDDASSRGIVRSDAEWARRAQRSRTWVRSLRARYESMR